MQAQYTNLKFENLDTEEGLSSSTCTEIFQDSDGFLWFGTIDGLNKYNGYDFKIFRPELNNPNSLSNNRISSIVEDNSGNLWIGTANGLNVFDKDTEGFKRIKLFKSTNTNEDSFETINTLLFDKNSNSLWVGTKLGAVRLHIEDTVSIFQNFENIDHFSYESGDDFSLDNNDVNNIVKDNEGTIWIGTEGNHLNKFNGKNFERHFIEGLEFSGLDRLPQRVIVDNENNFYIGNNLSYLIYWNRKINKFKTLEIVNQDVSIYDIYQDKNGVLWIATGGHGIYLYSKEKGLVQHLKNLPEDPFSLPNNQSSQVYEDSEGIIWIGTYNKGVSKQAPAKASFGHYFYQLGSRNGLSTRIAQSVLQDRKRRIWIGTDGGGLNLFNEATSTFEYYQADPQDPSSISSDKILYLTESHDGSIWICTWDGGVSRFYPEKGTAINYQYNASDPYSIGQNTAWYAVEDSLQRLWVGTQSEGLNLLDPRTNRFYKFKNIPGNSRSLMSDFVFSLFIDSKNRLLIGTSLGLSYIHLDKMENFIPEELDFKKVTHSNIVGNRINYITEDRSGNIWVGTDIGLYKLNKNLEVLESFSSADGLPNNLIVGIVQDDNGNMWITTKSGLSMLDTKSNSITNFNVHDGLQGMEFQSKSIEKTDDGRIIAGGINGFNIFNPDAIETSSADITPIITRFKLFNDIVKPGDTINERVLFNNAISRLDHLKLRYDENHLAFEFVALHYQNPERVNYSYRMAGIDDKFIRAGLNRTANYSNLPPGDYVFEVKASLGDNWENARIAKVNIEILPPPWRTWWAYITYIILVFALVWFFFWYYSKKVKEEKENELHQMKLRFFINISHEFRTPLTLILNSIDKILSVYKDPLEVKKSAQIIQRSARRLLYLINQLLDFRKMEMGRDPLRLTKTDIIKFSDDTFKMFEGIAEEKNINFIFTSAYTEYDMYFDLDKYEKILTNLLSNALKFTKKGGTVKLDISEIFMDDSTGSKFIKKLKVKEYIQIRVEDTGVGFKKEQLKEVFSRFYNVDNTKTGTGIGLNFTKALVELHGGRIWVESEYGKGSSFIVNLPVEPPQGEKGRMGELINKLDSVDQNINTVKSAEYEIAISNEDEKLEKVYDKTENKEKPSILIVEDNKELRNHLKNELQDHFIIKEAKDGAIGYNKVKKYYPDIVISDVMMPNMDGFELCRLIKTDFDTCHIPVILLTARGMEEDKIEGYKTGADEYLPKPFNIYILQARINNLLEAKKRIREKFTSISGVAASSDVTTNSLDEVFLDKTTKIIIDNIADTDFQLDDIIKELAIGRSQFYRKITGITGENPSTFIRTIRLKYAADLLLKKRYSVKEVTHMTGFNSSAYFSKTFKEFFEVTPTQFIKQKGTKPDQ
ncbi:hybrid sensor histidine kinase/response regulator [Gramella sp. AN32]|nr:hybrid sensor histidine kinase/response regulator [Gramella sp. AN32]